MADLLCDLLHRSAEKYPGADALFRKKQRVSYERLAADVTRFARGLHHFGIERNDRVGIYLPKRFETVIGLFGTAHAGGVFVPINPLLKTEQIEYIQRDCNVRIAVTSKDRLAEVIDAYINSPDLHTVVVVDAPAEGLPSLGHINVVTWEHFLESDSPHSSHRRIDMDMAAIFYTSGSTGKPKGVVLSHKNMVTGAKSVAQYLENTNNDKLLAALPFSFDYGFSQLSTAFSVGASVTLMDYLLPKDVVNAVTEYRVTGLAGVPTLWTQLSTIDWPPNATGSLRYLTNSGSAMPKATLDKLRKLLPTTKIFLMYGLTEAFRSTYLPPDEIDRRPDSIGKAIPNAEILVVRDDGSLCAPGEPGELVHRGSLVSLGYWNDPIKTAERFKPAPNQIQGMTLTEIAVWSGDTVRMDDEGYLYFIGRKDDMIKTSGYRVSPTEIEEVVYSTGLVGEVAAVGIPHSQLGQAIVVAVTKNKNDTIHEKSIIDACKHHLPNFMLPVRIIEKESLPRNPNGKIDRKLLASELQTLFVNGTE